MKPSYIFIFLTLLFNGVKCQINEGNSIPPLPFINDNTGNLNSPVKPVTSDSTNRVPPLPIQPVTSDSTNRVPPLPIQPVTSDSTNRVPPLPVKPVKPVDTSDPVKPVKPVDPPLPVKPVDPRDPVKPVDPRDPVKPVDPRDPVKPIDMRGPVDPRVYPVKPTRPDFDDKYKNVSYILFDEEDGVLFSKDKEINYEFKHDSKTKYVIDEYIELYDVIVKENSTIALIGTGVIELFGTLNVSGTIIIATELIIQGIIYTSPESKLTINNTLTSGKLNQDSFCLFDGLTNGVGTMNCTIINNGVLSPGFSPGIINVASLVLETDSVVYMEIQDISHDLIVSHGNVFIDGTFVIDFSGDIQPGIYTMISGEQIIGTFKSFVITGLSQEFSTNFIINNSSFVVEITPNQQNNEQPQENNDFNYTNVIIGVACTVGCVAIISTIIIRKKKSNNQLLKDTSIHSYINPLIV